MPSPAYLYYDPREARTTVSCGVKAGDPAPDTWQLYVDGVRQGGTWVDTHWVGVLYRAQDGEWGHPRLTYGDHEYQVRVNGVRTELGGISVGNPRPTLGTGRLSPVEVLHNLWAAGFRTEAHLLMGLSIAASESGFYPHARNWLPSSGPRPSTDIIGVQGPTAAWWGRTQQGHSDRGLYQYNSLHHPDVSDAQADDPYQASVAMFRKTNGGTTWKPPWGVKDKTPEEWYGRLWDQSSSSFPALRPIVQQFLATNPPGFGG